MEAGEREFFQRYHDQVHALLLGSLCRWPAHAPARNELVHRGAVAQRGMFIKLQFVDKLHSYVQFLLKAFQSGGKPTRQKTLGIR